MYSNFYKCDIEKKNICKFIGYKGINIKNIISNLKKFNYNIQYIHLSEDGVFIKGDREESVEFCREFLKDFFATEGFLYIEIDNTVLSRLIGEKGSNVKFLTDYIFNCYGTKCYLHFQNNGVLIKGDNGTNLHIISNFIYNYICIEIDKSIYKTL